MKNHPATWAVVAALGISIAGLGLSNAGAGKSAKASKASKSTSRTSQKTWMVRPGVITDERADRMRIIAPIISTKDLSKDDLLNLLEANFDRALDAKYTVFEDAVWATFVHPLSTLTRQELVSAVKQVAALRNTYGSTYSSMDVVFGGGGN